MNDFVLVVLIASLAGILTYLGAPRRKVTLPHAIVSAALQFSAGIITALVAFSLMPAVMEGTLLVVLLAFFVGGAAFVALEYYAARQAPPDGSSSPGL